ncbi:YopX family protein [Mediterraneibacter gnavus]|uniref:YopX family protein n=1 Tax=Mediterraneibacter gnavus TaxID=33038 RepID=UPI00232F4A45|nr:YopX family protein [Mediterraneibacter gnavus]MDB8712099.1 YopX family protein [Mediterraneibacter gnavus]MDB8715138.1 YopX family protein [Mediterraneibacter gnavus]
MSREILFRAKRKDNGEWVEGDLEHTKYDDVIWIVDVRGEKCYRCDSDTICQYTGLTDKNGKKIWENDIVRYTFDYPSETATENGLKERISSVFWSKWRGSWSVYADERKGKGMNNDLFKYARNGNTVEVIGNIFDNPELLEE